MTNKLEKFNDYVKCEIVDNAEKFASNRAVIDELCHELFGANDLFGYFAHWEDKFEADRVTRQTDTKPITERGHLQ